MRQHFTRARHTGVSLIETLVVIAIIGTLIALLVPAIQRVREAAARTQCANNLHQIGLALHSHHGSFKRFPSGGWGWDWVGVPSRSSGPQQPGGWLFSILPFVEQENLFSLGDGAGPQIQSGMMEMVGSPVSMFNCPSRRDGGPYRNALPYPYLTGDSQGRTYKIQPLWAARSDYAGNCGSQLLNQWNGGPASLAQGDAASYPWPTRSQFNGVFLVHDSIAAEWIRHGSSNTFLAGERYLDPMNYTTGADLGDNENLFIGFDNDVIRSTYSPPMQDTWGLPDTTRFGSAHPAGLNMLYADGSVRLISFGIDPYIFLQSGERDE
jgi:prepilin-type processing-associated H-X9-DG protein